MNIVLWVVQVALALQALAGGASKVLRFDDIANMPAMRTMSRGGWAAVGVFEMVCGVLLVVPAAVGWMPESTPVAALALMLESMALAVLYARYSLKVTATNPLIYVVAAGLVAAFVAYGRFALVPMT